MYNGFGEQRVYLVVLLKVRLIVWPITMAKSFESKTLVTLARGAAEKNIPKTCKMTQKSYQINAKSMKNLQK
jgi:hypothetical protein